MEAGAEAGIAAAATSSLSGAGEALPGEAVLLLLSPRDATGLTLTLTVTLTLTLTVT